MFPEHNIILHRFLKDHVILKSSDCGKFSFAITGKTTF